MTMAFKRFDGKEDMIGADPERVTLVTLVTVGGGGTPSNTYAEEELKAPEAQGHTSEFAFDEQFMRGFLEWKTQLSESMIISYGECGSSEEEDGAESGDEHEEWTEDGDMREGRGWIENDAADRLGVVVTWLQKSDENSSTVQA